MIISLELPPASPLSRAALATQFGVSSMPIRDALMRLEEEGLVDVFPQYATVVSQVDVRRAQQAHFLRQAVELEIVRMLALRHDRAFAAELAATIARQQHSAKAGDFEKFMAADNEFHSQLYAAADKQDIWSLVRSRSGHIDRLRRLHLPPPARPRISCGIINSSQRRSAPASPMRRRSISARICPERSANSPQYGRGIRNI